jgi:dolichol-phosphate mannosyltransferase
MTSPTSPALDRHASDPPEARPSPTITLIVPALNEEKLIVETVNQIVAVTKGRFADAEVILVNDGSTDATGRLMDELSAQNACIRVLHNARNIGLGASYHLGVAQARNEYVMLLCGDGGMPASSLPAIFDEIGSADIVVPYCTNLKDIKRPGRYLLSRTYTLLLNTLFGLRLKYYNGLPVHRVALVRSVGGKSEGFGFQAEILVQLLKAGCSYVEVGVLGAEKANRSSALKLKNVVSVTRTLARLLRVTFLTKSATRASRSAPAEPRSGVRALRQPHKS